MTDCTIDIHPSLLPLFNLHLTVIKGRSRGLCVIGTLILCPSIWILWMICSKPGDEVHLLVEILGTHLTRLQSEGVTKILDNLQSQRSKGLHFQMAQVHSIVAISFTFIQNMPLEEVQSSTISIVQNLNPP